MMSILKPDHKRYCGTCLTPLDYLLWGKADCHAASTFKQPLERPHDGDLRPCAKSHVSSHLGNRSSSSIQQSLRWLQPSYYNLMTLSQNHSAKLLLNSWPRKCVGFSCIAFKLLTLLQMSPISPQVCCLPMCVVLSH